ncbi:MAG: mevalonate kinase [Nitrososphaerales archaeon]
MVASAPGKIIITGEHFVVHGSFAVAAAINKRARVSVSETDQSRSLIYSKNFQKSFLSSNDGRFFALKTVASKVFAEFGKPRTPVLIKVDSEIPLGSGLGSSAAVSVAAAGALTRFLGNEVDKDKLLEIASEGEKKVHGNPSGIDTETSLNGGVLLFNKKSGSKSIPLTSAIKMIAVFSGIKRDTGKLVKKVALKRKESPYFFSSLVDSSSFTSLEVADALSNGDLPYLGSLMSASQCALAWIGASTVKLDELIETALENQDCFGAKLTGAGGGGSIIALPKPEKAELLLERISKKYRDSFIVSIPQEGLTFG